MSQRWPSFLQRMLRFVTRHAWSLSLSGSPVVAFLSLASEIQEGELGPFDRSVADWFAAARGHWDGPMLALTRFGAFPCLATLCALAALVLALLGRRRDAVYVVACGSGAALLTAALKLLFERVRPDVSAHYLVGMPKSFAFPSGHAMGSISVVASLVVVAHGWPVARAWWALSVIVAVPLILGVAASRIYFGVHYASDVVGGNLVGAAWVAALTGWFYPRLLPAEASGQS